MMKPIKITYEHKTAGGEWITREYTAKEGKDYERVINTIHQNKDEYRVIKVERLDSSERRMRK